MPSSAHNLSQHQELFQWVGCLHQMTKSFSISPSKQYSGLISLKIDGFDLLAVHETFRSLLQHHSLKASILWRARPNIQHNHNQYTTSHVKKECCHQPFSGDWLPALPDAYLWTACHLEEWCASDQLFGRVMHMLIKTVKQTNKKTLCSVPKS